MGHGKGPNCLGLGKEWSCWNLMKTQWIPLNCLNNIVKCYLFLFFQFYSAPENCLFFYYYNLPFLVMEAGPTGINTKFLIRQGFFLAYMSFKLYPRIPMEAFWSRASFRVNQQGDKVCLWQSPHNTQQGPLPPHTDGLQALYPSSVQHSWSLCPLLMIFFPLPTW